MNFNFSQTYAHAHTHMQQSVCVYMSRSRVSFTCINSILCPCTHTLFPPSPPPPSAARLPPSSLPPFSDISSLTLLLSPFLSPLSCYFLHHNPLLYLFKPVLLSLPLLVSPSNQSLILCFLILPREAPDIRFIRSSLVSELPHFHLVHFFLISTSRVKISGVGGGGGNKINDLHLGNKKRKDCGGWWGGGVWLRADLASHP